MDDKLSARHLEVLLKLRVSEEPIVIVGLDKIKFASDLVNKGLASREERKEDKYIVPYYQITNGGINYLKNINSNPTH